jgi:hypothetical protein
MRQSQPNIRNHESHNADRDGERHRRATSYGSNSAGGAHAV